MPQMWQVVGGADRGGVLVRQGQELSSEKAAERLSTGAIVAELELVGERLHYRRVTGTGPEEGWIGVALEHKELARRLPVAKAAWLPKTVHKELKWLLWNQMSYAANAEFAEHRTGNDRKDALEDAADDAMRVDKYASAVEATEYFHADELLHLRDQAKALGWEAGSSVVKGRPLADEATEALEAPRGFAPELWNRMLMALLAGAKCMCLMLRKQHDASRQEQSKFEQLWDKVGIERVWYEEAPGSPAEEAAGEDGITFRVVHPNVKLKSQDGRHVGLLYRGATCRGEVRTLKDTREWLRIPKVLNRELLEEVKWKDGEAWINLSEGRPVASVNSLRDKGLVILGCTQLYSHVKYFARLGEWLRERGHEVLLFTIGTDKTRQAASEHLPSRCLRLLDERPEDQGYWSIWEQVSRDGNATDESIQKFYQSAGYIEWHTSDCIRRHRPNLVVVDGWDNDNFNNTCRNHAGARAIVTCPARKDGFNDNKGAERYPTLYPTVPSLFDGEIHPTTIVCGPFLPPPEKLERTKVLEEGTHSLQQWCSADSRPIIYISFGTVAVMQQEFLQRFSRAILSMCGVDVPTVPALRPGCACRIHGLQSETGQALNGQEGCVIRYMRDVSRYEVDVGGSKKALKAENLEAIAAEQADKAAQEGEAGGAADEGEWLVLYETTCGNLSDLVSSIACGTSPKDVRECRELCRLEGYGGFCLHGEVAHFWRLSPSELVASAEAKEHAVLHFPAEATLGKPAKPPAQKAGDQAKPRFRFLWSLPSAQQKLLPQEALRPSQDLRVEQFVPQQSVLRLQQVAAAISHCGANSSHEALACGVPMVCVPFFMDQYDWCRAVVRRGVGVPVDRRTASERDICAAVELTVSRCTEGAAKFGKETRQFLREGSGLDRAGNLCLRAMGYA